MFMSSSREDFKISLQKKQGQTFLLDSFLCPAKSFLRISRI